ncbi:MULTISPECIES: patatin-like phospholipase family protein [Petrimonas]|uniref:Putative NTE family protein YlbK n=2 Tax=Petrimonas mucosa TaxID=1642646 RepID=A0A1G4G831_9BACT|nr:MULTISPECIES: patatin-like phospholipase family protein [Petrimonas]MDD3560383.1 patatin-like phospholipase family protein [Petrimonas mucosa]SCM58587.1 putative NTE family protein YlbK [Petrimonas mucosa]SFU28753.1 NTE family protein [Porphyromonadaceae bacterium KHP3R9]HHT28750.1 patatin-like phospholipase family protein [Petrimonas mucosa]
MGIFGKDYDYYLGYALSGGGAKGFAHLGAFMVFESYGLKPDVIVGTSAGALAGVFYADGFTPEEISELFRKHEFREFFEFSVPKAGLFKNSGLEKFLKNNLRSSSFEQLKVPFKAVTTDWERARTVVFSEGRSLVDAVVASCSVPIVFTPKVIGGTPYVDGGLLKNFPVSVIRDNCKYVIGVNVSMITSPPEKVSIRTTAERTFKLMSNSNTLVDRSMCDILVETAEAQKYFMFDLNNIDRIREIGYESASSALGEERSLEIVKRCHRHYQLEERVKQQIDKIRKLSS